MFITYIISTNTPWIQILKNNGMASLSMMSAAGASVSTPAVISEMNPTLMEFVPIVTAQQLTVVVTTSLITPIIVKKYSEDKL